MHIVFVTTEFVTDQLFFGGLANFTANMASIFAENNHKVTVVVAGLNNDERTIKWKNNVTVEYIRFRYEIDFENSNELLINSYLYYRGFIIRKKINEISKKNRVDVVHYCHLLAVGLLRDTKIPSVIRISSYPGIARHADRTDYNINKNLYDLTAVEKLELKVVKRAKAVVSPSKIAAELLQKTIHKKPVVIESPFYQYQDGWDNSEYEKVLKDKKYLLFYGSLSRGKGIHIIDNILYDVLDRYRDLNFVFIGNDAINAHKKLKRSAKQYSDRVFNFRAMAKDKLFPIINNAHACVLPSVMDNLPNTCIESMGLGKVVIGTIGASFDQLITDGVSGILCKKESQIALSQAIDRVMQLAPQQRDEIGRNAKKRIEKISPEKVYNRYLNYYLKVINLYNKRSN